MGANTTASSEYIQSKTMASSRTQIFRYCQILKADSSATRPRVVLGMTFVADIPAYWPIEF